MARPKKATVEYFPHFCNNGKTMFTIDGKYGNEGYAFWFKLLEILGVSEHHFIDCNDSETWEFLLAKTRFNEVNAIDILELLSRLNAINKDMWKYKIIRSENFILNLQTVYSRRDVNVMSNSDILYLCKQKHPLNGLFDDIKPQSKGKESKEEESKENNKEAETFLKFPPEYLVSPEIVPLEFDLLFEVCFKDKIWLDSICMVISRESNTTYTHENVISYKTKFKEQQISSGINTETIREFKQHYSNYVKKQIKQMPKKLVLDLDSKKR